MGPPGPPGYVITDPSNGEVSSPTLCDISQIKYCFQMFVSQTARIRVKYSVDYMSIKQLHCLMLMIIMSKAVLIFKLHFNRDHHRLLALKDHQDHRESEVNQDLWECQGQWVRRYFCVKQFYEQLSINILTFLFPMICCS